MNNIKIYILALMSILLLSCESKEEEAKVLPQGYHAVVVRETMDADKYTYMKVVESGREFWIASEKVKVAPDDTVYYSNATPMSNFESKTLNRTFDNILFISDISLDAPAMANASSSKVNHPEIEVKQDEAISLDPVDGGLTVQQVYDDKGNLEGKTVLLRGKVTKFNPDILNKNWIHIQDGTKSGEHFDMLVTSQEVVKVGDIIVVEGVVAVDKDFGAGYKYDVLVEEAKVVENEGQESKI